MPLKKDYSKPKVGDVRYYIFGNPDPFQMTMMVVDVVDVIRSPAYFRMVDVEVKNVIIDDNPIEIREPGSTFEAPREYLVDTLQNAKRRLIQMTLATRQYKK